MVGRVVIFVDVKSSGDDPKVDCPLEVAVALDRERRFSTLLDSTVDPSDAAVRQHGLSARKLRELKAPKPADAPKPGGDAGPAADPPKEEPAEAPAGAPAPAEPAPGDAEHESVAL